MSCKNFSGWPLLFPQSFHQKTRFPTYRKYIIYYSALFYKKGVCPFFEKSLKLINLFILIKMYLFWKFRAQKVPQKFFGRAYVHIFRKKQIFHWTYALFKEILSICKEPLLHILPLVFRSNFHKKGVCPVKIYKKGVCPYFEIKKWPVIIFVALLEEI